MRITAAELNIGGKTSRGETVYPREIACLAPGARGRHGAIMLNGDATFSLVSLVAGLPESPPASFPTEDAAVAWLVDQISLRLADLEALAGEARR